MATEEKPGEGERPAEKHEKRRTRVMVDVSPELRRRIKVAAERSDLSIRAYIARVLEQAVPKDGGKQQPEQQASQG